LGLTRHLLEQGLGGFAVVGHGIKVVAHLDQPGDVLLTGEPAIEAKDCQQLIAAALDWAQLLNQHIYKEDNILYPMAEQGLSNEQKIEIRRRYRQAEQERDYQSVWQRHSVFVEQLEALLHI